MSEWSVEAYRERVKEQGRPGESDLGYTVDYGDEGRRPDVERDGRVYRFFNFYGRYEAKDDRSAPAVLCGNCTGDVFKIAYGSYECIAVCASCGYEQTVYDG